MSRAEVFTERALPYGRRGVRISIEVTAVVYDGHSDHGHILVLDTEFFGRILVIDGILQTTVSDEFIYHEMLTLTPMVRHGSPRNVLVVGGGDGGALRQALRMTTVESVVQVEIDPTVVEVSRRYLPEVSGGGFDDPRTRLVIGDGARFVADTADRYDVVVLDLTDPLPDSPAERLFEVGFLSRCRDILTPGGVLAMQCGSLTFQPDEVATMHRRVAGLFGDVALHHAVVPGYQLTSFGFLVAADRPQPGDADLVRGFSHLTGTSGYLTPDTYRSSTVLPPYLAYLTG